MRNCYYTRKHLISSKFKLQKAEAYKKYLWNYAQILFLILILNINEKSACIKFSNLR